MKDRLARRKACAKCFPGSPHKRLRTGLDTRLSESRATTPEMISRDQREQPDNRCETRSNWRVRLGFSILVTDDVTPVRNVMRRALENAGYDVCEASDGDEAIRALRCVPFDLVITDVIMPNRDGLETISYIRRESPGTRVIVMSGAANQLFLDSAKQLGATRILVKPFAPSELVDIVRDVLQDNGSDNGHHDGPG